MSAGPLTPAVNDVTGRHPTIHANALLVGATAILVRGASGAGKSALTLDLLATAAAEGRFSALIGDDRVSVTDESGRLVVHAPPAIAGRIERRGSGIEAMSYEPAGVVGLVVDLVEGTPERLPEPAAGWTSIAGIRLPRLVLAGFGAPRTRDVLAALDRLPNGLA